MSQDQAADALGDAMDARALLVRIRELDTPLLDDRAQAIGAVRDQPVPTGQKGLASINQMRTTRPTPPMMASQIGRVEAAIR